MELIGRKSQQESLKHMLASSESKLAVIIGRRRVGKTFLIRKYFEGKFTFDITALHNGDMDDQLKHFTQTLVKKGYYPAHLSQPESWMAAFEMLGAYIDEQKSRKKKVLFFDELPWFDTPRSKFLMAFENFWNTYCTKRNDIVCIICGSAASWMIKKILKNKGGLHNRVSEKIRLQPFSLSEVEAFLKVKGIKWSRYDIAQLYLTTGGIPYYLDAVRKGESVVQYVDRVCFKKEGILYDEYEELYSSLFDDSEMHRSIVQVLSTKKQGMTRKELIDKTGFSSGGTLTKVLDELHQSDFIDIIVPYTQNKTKALYKLEDNFSLFYLKFMMVQGKRTKEKWTKTVMSQSWVSWAGFAFERLCFRHIQEIKRTLRIDVIASEVSSWSSKGTQGAQIDMLIDRADRIVNACEIKFSKGIFTIDKSYAQNLRNKIYQFSCLPQNRKKTPFLTMITTFGVADNEYYKELVQNEVTIEDLFD